MEILENKIPQSQLQPQVAQAKLLTLSEFRRELGIPLILAKRLVIWGEVKAIHALDGTYRIASSEVAVARNFVGTPINKARLFVRALGPGLITGASDDDPSGIGTYSSVGAAFGLSILWMAAWLLPVMTAIQEVCARIGVVTNKGLAGVLKEHFNSKVVFGAVSMLIVANVINIGADLGAMAASIGIFTDINFYAVIIFLAILITALEVLVKYHLYVRALKFLTIFVFAYVLTGFMVHTDWLEALKHTFVPSMEFSEKYLFAMIAVFGTTITPYLFFWQTSEEVEENNFSAEKKENSKKKMMNRISRMRTDVYTGMFLANVVFYFIILTTAQALFANGITNIDSAEEAALALAPLAGEYSTVLFALGIIGTGFLAIPILAGSGAYALSEILNWNEGLELKFLQAKGFYLIIIFSIFFGALFNFFGINPIVALYYAAFLNGIIAIPLIYLIMRIGNDPKIMGAETHPAWVKIFGWLALFLMASAIIFMVVLQLT